MNKRNILIFTIPLALYLIFELGLYQKKTIMVNDITFNRPDFYRMNLLTVSNNKSILSLIKDYFAFNSNFQIDKTQLIIFEQFLVENKIVLLFDYAYKIENLKKLSKKSVNYENCYYLFDKDESKNIYIFQGVIESNGMSFNLFGENKQDLIDIRNDICK